MSYILVNGCSHTVGFELEEEIGVELNAQVDADLYKRVQNYRKLKAWPYLIGNAVNLPVRNIASIGASNDKIIYETVEYLENESTPSFVIISLSSISRELFPFLERDVVFSYGFFSDMYHDLFAETGEEKELYSWAYCMSKYLYREDHQIRKLKHLLNYSTQYLQIRNIPFLFLPSITIPIQLSDYTKNCIDISMDTYCSNKGFRRAQGHHWLSDAHKGWSEVILKEVNI